jgi:hypothetical protein
MTNRRASTPGWAAPDASVRRRRDRQVPSREAQDEPSAGRHERVTVDVAAGPDRLGVLAALRTRSPAGAPRDRGRRAPRPAPRVEDGDLHLRVGQVAGEQPVPQQALRPGHRAGRQQRRALPRAHHPAYPPGASQTAPEGRGVEPAGAQQRVTEGEQFGRQQPLGQVEERLGAGGDAQARRLDHVLRAQVPHVQPRDRVAGAAPVAVATRSRPQVEGQCGRRRDRPRRRPSGTGSASGGGRPRPPDGGALRPCGPRPGYGPAAARRRPCRDRAGATGRRRRPATT